jgi:hypothetical protein
MDIIDLSDRLRALVDWEITAGIFQRNSYRDSDGDRRVSETGFYAIANPKDVEELLRDLARTSPSTP